LGKRRCSIPIGKWERAGALSQSRIEKNYFFPVSDREGEILI